jgi:hypothetical protein
MNKEQIYDEQISPLMTQIIAICKEHKIAFLASFSIPNDEDADLCCSSYMLDDDFEPPESFLRAKRELRPGARPVTMLRTVGGDGSVTMTAII